MIDVNYFRFFVAYMENFIPNTLGSLVKKFLAFWMAVFGFFLERTCSEITAAPSNKPTAEVDGQRNLNN